MNGRSRPSTGEPHGVSIGYVTMRSTLRLPFPSIGRAAAILAFLAQLTLLVAGLGEGKAGVGYAAHIDPGGTSTHYVHDEAVCAACQARSLHGVVRQPHPPTVMARPSEAAAAIRPESYSGSEVDNHNLSRAPPFVS